MRKVFKGIEDYYKLYNVDLKRSIYLMILFDFDCNFRCLKCFNYSDLGIKVSNRKIILSVKSIIDIIENAKKIGFKSVIFAGEGEPTLNKNIKEIIQSTKNIGLIPIIYTNGSTLNKEILSFYFNNNVSLVIALDSLDESTYNKVTRTTGMLPRVLDNIRNARVIYSKNIKEKNGLRIVQLAINTTVNSLNKNEISNIKEFCGDDIYFICNALANYGNAVNNWDELIADKKDYRLQINLVKKYSESGGPLTLNEQGVCGYSRNGISISPNGDYMTCAYTSKTSGLLGNIQDLSLSEAFKMKYKSESEFYYEFGNVPCLIRDENFEKYIKKLKSRQKANPNEIHIGQTHKSIP